MINIFNFFTINRQNLKNLTWHYSKNDYILIGGVALKQGLSNEGPIRFLPCWSKSRIAYIIYW